MDACSGIKLPNRIALLVLVAIATAGIVISAIMVQDTTALTICLVGIVATATLSSIPIVCEYHRATLCCRIAFCPQEHDDSPSVSDDARLSSDDQSSDLDP